MRYLLRRAQVCQKSRVSVPKEPCKGASSLGKGALVTAFRTYWALFNSSPVNELGYTLPGLYSTRVILYMPPVLKISDLRKRTQSNNTQQSPNYSTEKTVDVEFLGR